jgi:hypothetical protein
VFTAPGVLLVVALSLAVVSMVAIGAVVAAID